MSSLSKDQKRRPRRAEKQKRQRAREPKPPLLAQCGGGGSNYTRQSMIDAYERARDEGDEHAGIWAYFADSELVTIEDAKVVNRGERPVVVNVAVCQQRPDKIDLVSVRQNVKIAAGGFLDFAVYNARPLVVDSALADDHEIFQQLKKDHCIPEPPEDFGPWHPVDGLPGVTFSMDGYIHNATASKVKIVVVCSGETECGDQRCAIFKGNIPAEDLAIVRVAVRGATAELLLSETEKAAEAAEAAVRLAFGAIEAPWLDPEFIKLLAVVQPGTSRKAMRAIYDNAAAMAVGEIGASAVNSAAS